MKNSRWIRIGLALCFVEGACARHVPRLELPVLPEATAPRELTADQQVKQALSRLTFGTAPQQLARLSGQPRGLARWLQEQLTPIAVADPSGDSIVAAHPILRLGAAELTAESPPLDVFLRNRRRQLGLPDTAHYIMTAEDSADFKRKNDLGSQRAQELLGIQVARATLSERQLLEVLTAFWENHFSVFSGKMPTRFTLLEYDRDVIRPHALGKFRDLLGAVAHSPAMLYYLDNWQSRSDSGRLTLTEYQALSRARTPREKARLEAQASRRHGGRNENYGRELLELHTLGVDGGYTQEDVIGAARALSGWSIATPREGGSFVFRPEWHDAEPKRILGIDFPAGRGAEDGEHLLDLLARHPSTARFIATKLVRYFVSDTTPHSLIDRAAAEFQHSDGDIRRVMALIVSSPEFYSRAAYRSKVKDPFTLVVSTYRALGGLPDTLGRSAQLAARLGQPLWGRLTPDGWPDEGAAWMNTGAIVRRIRFGLDVGAGRVVGIRVREPAALPLEARVDSVIATILGGEATPETRTVLLTGRNPPARADSVATTMLPASVPNDRPTTGSLNFAVLVGLAIGAPEFQRR